MSTGSLRHIFPSHDDLFVAVLGECFSLQGEKIGQILNEARQGRREVFDACVEAISLVLPLTEKTLAESLSHLAILAGGGRSPALEKARRQAAEKLDYLCESIGRFSEKPEAFDAVELRLLIDGLMVRGIERGPEDLVPLLKKALVRMGIPRSNPRR
ncbi:hypothetical protein GCM10028828_17340 [Corynebacterium tapiri]